MQKSPAEDGGEEFTGGTMSSVVRVGDTVRRAAGPWTPTVHRLLHHLHAHGLDWVPRPLGVADGREVLTYLPGTVPQYPMPPWVWADDVLVDAAGRLAAFHAASADFDATGGTWHLPVHEPVEVICHNDVAPYNLVFDDQHTITGLIDWDTASPGPRAWDVAYLAYRLVPLTGPHNPDAPDVDLAERRRRLALLCEAYAHEVRAADVTRTAIRRLEELAEVTAARAAAGADHVAGHVRLYRDDARWLAEHLQRLQ